MPVALLREIDSHAVAMLSTCVGRSDVLDRTVAALAEHLAKLHVLLLGLLLLGPDGASRRRHRLTALRIGLVLPITMATVGAVGSLVGRQRPFTVEYAGPPLVDHAPGRSFPSRHSACAAAMATVALRGAPRIGWAMAILGVLLAVSRIYVGLHYPTDVVSGWAIGVGLGLLVRDRGDADGHRA
jgi:undecaprenyl-diphosphatase